MKAGVVGTAYGKVHIAGLEAAGVDVVAVCQRDQQGVRGVARQYQIPLTFSNWEELVASPEVELVTIAAPPHLHLAIAKKALGLGKHVICEKPLARSLEEARLMTRLAHRASAAAMTGFNWRFTAGMQRMKALVDSGFLGRLLHATGTWYGQRYAGPDASLSWRNEVELAGAGVLGDSGVHIIDALRWLAGEFRELVALSGIAYPGRELAPGKRVDAEDFCALLGILDSGAHVTLTFSRVIHATNFHRVHLFGTEGTLTYEFQREEPGWATGHLLAARGAGWETVPLEACSQDPAPSDFSERVGRATFAPLVRVLLGAVENGHEPSPSFEDGLRAQAVVDAAVRSMGERAWVQVPG